MRLYITGGLVLAVGFVILFISVLRTASVKYEKGSPIGNRENSNAQSVNIDYDLAYPGPVLPGSPLWTLKASRDKVWLFVTTNDSRKAELLLLFADKRIGAALLLLEMGDVENSIAAATKAEKYLEEAWLQTDENRRKGIKTDEFSKRLINASLRHYEVLLQLESGYPDQLRPVISNSKKYPMYVYEQSRNHLLEDGFDAPENPFKWQ